MSLFSTLFDNLDVLAANWYFFLVTGFAKEEIGVLADLSEISFVMLAPLLEYRDITLPFNLPLGLLLCIVGLNVMSLLKYFDACSRCLFLRSANF